MSRLLWSVLILFFFISVTGQVVSHANKQEAFSFIFMNDIHLTPCRGVAGFGKAIDLINRMNPDFVISGGDLLMDVNEQTEGEADSLFVLYMKCVKKLNMPVYNGIGNRDVFGLSQKKGITPQHPLYGKKMFESKLGKTYRSFMHKGWKFFILDDIDISVSKKYRGWIDSAQLAWIGTELAKVDNQTPVVLALHIPLISVMNQYDKGGTASNSEMSAVVNSKQLLDLFKGHNLKLVLQGHQNIYEDILVNNIRFVTGGAISGWKWNGPNRGTPAGFVLINVNSTKNGEVLCNYIDYGWKPVQKTD